MSFRHSPFHDDENQNNTGQIELRDNQQPNRFLSNFILVITK